MLPLSSGWTAFSPKPILHYYQFPTCIRLGNPGNPFYRCRMQTNTGDHSAWRSGGSGEDL